MIISKGLEKDKYLEGEEVYGDDFNLDQIMEWYRDEEKGYYSLYNKSVSKRACIKENHIHKFYVYNTLKSMEFKNALGLGSADGNEFIPFIKNIEHLTIIEIAEEFYKSDILGTPVEYRKPDVLGKLPYPDGIFDLIIASSVLHHIPNVTFVWSELTRCLKPGGILVSIEPIVYMGGMQGLRNGLTLRERGIPIKFFDRNLEKYEIISRVQFDHAITRKIICPFVKKDLAESTALMKLDHFLSKYFALNSKYYTKNLFRKLFQAASICMVLKKIQ